VIRISVAPVKSMALIHPDEVELGPGGIVGDRRFWLRDEEGALYAGKRDGSLLRVLPAWDESTHRLTLTFPDSEAVDGVVELGDEVDAVLYGWQLPSRKVRGPWEDAIRRYVGRPVELLWADDGAVDRATQGGTVSLVSRGSLERLQKELGVDDAVDGRRFRMTLEIEGVAAHEEDTWIGADVGVGEATLAVFADVGRCVITSRHPDTGETDLPTLKALADYRPDGRDEPLPFGVVASVVVPGRVRVGDIARRLSWG
jgi:uncharacterized protein